MGRQGRSFVHIVQAIKKESSAEILVCVESGRVARKAKLARMTKGSVGSLLATVTLQIPLLVLFNFFQEVGMFGLKFHKPWPLAQMIKISDVNEPELVSMVRAYRPDFIVNFGSGIYTPKTLSEIELPILNIHTGILPRYRNVYTDFWAYVNLDYSGLGVSIVRVDSGIDTGLVVTSRKNFPAPGDFLWTIKRRNLDIASDLVLELISSHPGGQKLAGSTSRPGTDADLGRESDGFWETPRPMDLIGYWLLEFKKSVSLR